MEVNGELLAELGVVEGGVTYVPLAPLVEALGGGSVAWDAASRTARADTGVFTLTVPIGEDWLLADGYRFGLDQPAILRGGRTCVPLRPAANLLGAQVTWNGWDAPVEVRTAPPAACNEEDLLAEPDHQRREPGGEPPRSAGRRQRSAAADGGPRFPGYHPGGHL